MIKVNVINRSHSTIAYSIPDKHIRREFFPLENKNVDKEELLMVALQPGGIELLTNYFIIEDKETLNEILNQNNVEPEYWLTNEVIPNWMVTCSLDEFKDALDFAPEGVKELIKQNSVSIPLNDMAKRQAIFDQLHFDVTKAIELNLANEVGNSAETQHSGRRTAPKYKVVNKDN